MKFKDDKKVAFGYHWNSGIHSQWGRNQHQPITQPG